MISGALNWIKGALQTMLNFFLEIGLKIWELICKVGSYVFDFFFDEQEGLVWWIFDQFIAFGKEAISWFPDIESLLTQYQGTAVIFQEQIGGVNAFFPVVESAVLLGVFITVVLTAMCIRWTVKIIRGA